MKSVAFATEQTYLGDTLSWSTVKSGVVRFSTTRDAATQSMAKRRQFGSFCLFLLCNFSSLVYRAMDPLALLAYSSKIHRHHDWLLNRDGRSLYHFDTDMSCGATSVLSTLACNSAASFNSRFLVHFGAHPLLTRVVQLRTSSRRWLPQRKPLKHIIYRRLRQEGNRLRDKRVTKPDF